MLLSPAFYDFPQDPLKIFLCLFVFRKDINRILDGNRSEALKPPPNFDAEIIGFGRDLVNEQEPSAFGILHSLFSLT